MISKLTIKQAAEKYDCSKSDVYFLVSAGWLWAEKINGVFLLTEEEATKILALMAEREKRRRKKPTANAKKDPGDWLAHPASRLGRREVGYADKKTWLD